MTERLYPLRKFSGKEWDKLAEFEAAPEPEEIRVERVARAIWESQPGTVAWGRVSEITRTAYRLRAPLVIAALDPS